MSTTDNPTDPGEPMSVEEILHRAEIYALSAAILADQYVGSGTSAADLAVHQGVLHESTLAQAFTALAMARLRHAVQVQDEEEQARQADPRAALRETAAAILEARHRQAGRYRS